MIRPLFLTVSALALIGCSPDAVDTADTGNPVVSLPDLDSVDFPHEASDLPMDEAVTYGVLPNGLRYAVMENSTPSRTATLLMRIDAGSLDETDETRGLAHFLEHMAFNGSENIPEGEMTKRLERLGLAFGADTNASTSFDETTYQLELPEVSDELLDEALSIFRETAERLTLDPDAIERERGVILAERRARNSPGYRAAIDGLRFQSEPSGLVDRLPIGVPETIESVTPEDFRSFYQAQYRPEDTFIVLVGDRPVEQLAQKIEAAFADWEAVGKPTDDAEVKPFSIDRPRFGAFFDPEITTRLSLSTLTPARPDERERDTVANRAAELPLYFANAMMNRRYAKLLRQGEAEFTSANVGAGDVFGAARTTSLSVASETDSIEPAFLQAERELRRALDHGFGQAELDEQLANARKSFEVRVQTSPTRRTPRLARQILSTFAGENVMTSAASDLDRYDEAVKSLTLEDVTRAFQDEWKAVETAPQLYLQSDEVIDDAEGYLEGLLERSRSVSLDAPEAVTAGTFAYTEWGEPGRVAKRDYIEDIGMDTVVFDNGVRLTMKRTPYETDVIRTRVRAGNGTAQFDPADRAFGTQLGVVLSRSALGQHDADQLATVTAGRTVGVRRGFTFETMQLGGSTVPGDFELQMQLMLAHLTDPAYREEVVETFRKQVRTIWPKIDSTPGGAAGKYIPPIIYNDHPTSQHPEEADVVDIDLKDLERWYDKNVTGGPIEIAVVGDIDRDEVVDVVARTFGTLPKRPAPKVKIPEAMVDYTFPEGRTRPHVVTHTGEPDTALVRVYWPTPNHDDAMTDRELGMLATVFRLELTERLREQEGATYSPSAYTNLPEHNPDWGFVAASVEVNPDEAEAVTALIEAAALDLATNGVTDDAFDRAIKPTLENLETSLENNGFWLGLASEAQSDPETLERYRERDEAYQNMTAADVSAQAKAVFDPKRAIRVHVLPEG